MAFQEKFQLSREKLEFIYSLALLVLIPVLIVANTLVMSVAVRKNFNTELRRKAALANNLIAAAAKQNLASASKLQSQVNDFSRDNQELKLITIAVPTSSQQYKVIASTEKTAVGTASPNVLYQVAASNNQPVAQEITQSDGDRQWSVVSPVSANGTVQAIVASNVSTQQADALIGTTLLQSLGIVVATVLLVVLLLGNHFKFVQYAMLFRKLKEVDQLKNDFLSVATHELRAPMTVIKGSIENLSDGIGGTVDEAGKKTLATIASEADRLTNLVNDLLNVSRLEQGRISYQLGVVDAREVIRPIVDQYTAKASAKGLALSYEAPAEPAWVEVDKGRLTEIMTNLVDNAIKYSRQGTVAVSHKPVAGRVQVSVRDTGIGIAAKDRERLFSRFYRVQTEASKGIPGTGLGLWIIKQYIEAMHGTISVDSLEGVGTEFIVDFPQASAPVSQATPAISESSAA